MPGDDFNLLGSSHFSFVSQLYAWIESISLNLHSRVKIEDVSHGCTAIFSSVKSQLSGGGVCVLHYPERGCEFVLFPFLSLSLQDSLVNTDELTTVCPKRVMRKEMGLSGRLTMDS